MKSSLDSFKLYYQELPKKVRYSVAKPAKRLKKTFAKKRNQRKGIYSIGLILILSLGIALVVSQVYSHNKSYNYALQRQSWQSARVKLQEQLTHVQAEQVTSQAQIQQKAQDEATLHSQIDSLNAQLQTRKQSLLSQAVAVVAPQAYAAPAPTITSGCGDNFYANFIYMHESGCNASAINPSSGAGGVGQALPFSKTGCSLGDYACQNAYFTAYANATYGGWAGAYSFWLQNHWW